MNSAQRDLTTMPSRRITFKLSIGASVIRVLLACFFFYIPNVLNGHPGALDSNKGHHDRANGGYHKHTGVDWMFSNKSESDIEELRKRGERRSQYFRWIVGLCIAGIVLFGLYVLGSGAFSDEVEEVARKTFCVVLMLAGLVSLIAFGWRSIVMSAVSIGIGIKGLVANKMSD